MMKKGKKLCWNCEGELERDSILCRFCGVNVVSTPSKNEGATALPFAQYAGAQEAEEKESGEGQDEESYEKGSNQISFAGFFALILGCFFLIFALGLLVFSKDGYLFLKWDASYWLLYALISLPLIFVGWRISRDS